MIKKILIFIILFVLIIMTYTGYVISSHKKEIVAINNQTTSTYYGNSRTFKINEEDINYYDMLYLRSDGTFYLSINSYDEDDILVGEYSMNDSFLTLMVKIRYSKNGCFYKDEAKTIVADIEDNKIIIDYNDEKLEYVKNIGIGETINNMNYYVTSPIDGENPSNIYNTWKDCSKKVTKK